MHMERDSWQCRHWWIPPKGLDDAPSRIVSLERGKAELDLSLEKSGQGRPQMASWHFHAPAIAQTEREKPPHPAA